MTITVHDGGLYVFLVAGTPKRHDLRRDPRFALHSFPSLPARTLDSYVDDEILIFGVAEPLDDSGLRAEVAAVHNDTVHERDLLFELKLDRVQHKTRHEGKALYRRWAAQAPAA